MEIKLLAIQLDGESIFNSYVRVEDISAVASHIREQWLPNEPQKEQQAKMYEAAHLRAKELTAKLHALL